MELIMALLFVSGIIVGYIGGRFSYKCHGSLNIYEDQTDETQKIELMVDCSPQELARKTSIRFNVKKIQE